VSKNNRRGGFFIIILAMVIFSFSSLLYWIVIGLVFMGVGFAFFSIPNSKLLMGAVEKRFLGGGISGPCNI
jgi:hypothetical protein